MTSKKIFNAEGFYRLGQLSGLAFQPGKGGQILFTVTNRDREKNEHVSKVMLTSANGTKTILNGHTAKPSPDGNLIAFLRDDNDSTSLTLYHLDSGQETRLTNIYSSEYFMGHLAEKNFAFSPDGKYIAYIGSHKPSDPVNNEIKITDRLLYKTKGGRGREYFADNRCSSIWLVPVKGGKPQMLTEGIYNEHSLNWSPDSSEIVFVSNRTGREDHTHQNDLFIIDIHTRKIKQLTNATGARFKPSWSPDGNHIAYLAQLKKFTSKDSPAEDTHVFIINPAGEKEICLTRELDRRADNIQWQHSSGSIFFTAGNKGSNALYKVSLSGKTTTVSEGDFFVKDYAVDHSSENIAYIQSGVTQPDELFLFNTNKNKSVQVSQQNIFIKEYVLSDAEMFWFKSSDNTPVQGWLMKPASFKKDKRFPLVLVIHGGPHNMFGYEFEERMQLLSAAGYGVLFINPRGSHGYGNEFSRGCVLNWGGGDYKDLMAGIDHVIRRNNWIDENRLCVTGQSYGGYMTNWIITQTNRFKAAVADGGISNLISFAGTSLYHCLIEAEFNGNIWDNYPLLWQWSPLQFVKRVTTPTLFLHGEKDNEVPVTQAEEMYSALKRLGVTAEFVRYVDEGHGWRPDLRPANRIDLYERIIKWFDRYAGR